MRLTKQKAKLDQCVRSLKGFFSAQDLAAQAGSVGIATVYRFLATEVQLGEIHSFTCSNRMVYSRNQTNHAHFVCDTCGKTRHLTIQNVDFLANVTDEKVCHFQIELTGTCKNCTGKR